MIGWGWLLFGVLFLAVLVVGILFVVRALTDGDTRSGRTVSSALQILEERFARGEIDRDEFEEHRRALES